jgi:putative acetyltransferase
MDQHKVELPPGVEIRYTEPGDAKHLKEWLMEPETGCWFPMDGEMEVDDAVMRWIVFHRYKCTITILKDGIPCGIATLYLQPYRKLAHQCEFGIIVGKNFRNQGIGSYLMSSLMKLVKEKFKIELLHLQVYGGNPAIEFYKRFGFSEFGCQQSWIKEKDGYAARVFMERFL